MFSLIGVVEISFLAGDLCGRFVAGFEAQNYCKVAVTKYLTTIILHNDKLNKRPASKASTSLSIDNLSLKWGEPQWGLPIVEALESDDDTHVIRPYVLQSLFRLDWIPSFYSSSFLLILLFCNILHSNVFLFVVICFLLGIVSLFPWMMLQLERDHQV